jgi:hypothetical protein
MLPIGERLDSEANYEALRVYTPATLAAHIYTKIPNVPRCKRKPTEPVTILCEIFRKIFPDKKWTNSKIVQKATDGKARAQKIHTEGKARAKKIHNEEILEHHIPLINCILIAHRLIAPTIPSELFTGFKVDDLDLEWDDDAFEEALRGTAAKLQTLD